MSDQDIRTKTIKNEFSNILFYTQSMKVKDVVYIHYVAVRGKDQEEGAVQRVLNKQRIKSIKEFVLSGNMFVNTFILNWTEGRNLPVYDDDHIIIPLVPSSAMVIDGQHRLAGLQEAMNEDETIGEKEILVSICIQLLTKDAARIFLNINSEQKPVPKSLIYDLYGIVEDDKEHAISRAKDIASELNENADSPYYKSIKFPGSPRGSGFIDLSTVISSLKNYLEPDGLFATYNLKDLNLQKQVIINYLSAIKYYYEKEGIWANRAKNPFLQNAGFYASIDFLAITIMPKCAEKKSFKIETFKSLLSLDSVPLLLQVDIKGMDGKSARKAVKEFLESSIIHNLPNQTDYEF